MVIDSIRIASKTSRHWGFSRTVSPAQQQSRLLRPMGKTMGLQQTRRACGSSTRVLGRRAEEWQRGFLQEDIFVDRAPSAHVSSGLQCDAGNRMAGVCQRHVSAALSVVLRGSAYRARRPRDRRYLYDVFHLSMMTGMRAVVEHIHLQFCK